MAGPGAPDPTLPPPEAPPGLPRWLVEPARPSWIRSRPGAFWWAVAAVCIGAFMGQLDASIVTVALPTLQRQFHAGLGAVTWVGLSYLLVLVGGVVAVGRTADMIGRKLLYLYGFVVFIVGSALCGLAPSLGALDGFRVLQGVGAVMLQANSVAIITVATPVTRLGRAIGIQGAAQAVGLALGPTIGGLLLSAGGWRLIFLVNVPFGLLGALAGWIFIPRSRSLSPRRPFDWAGLALFLPAVGAILGAITFGNELGWTSAAVLGGLGAGLGLAAWFVRRERRTAHPMLDLSLFASRRFSAGIVSGLLSYLVMFGVLFVVPFLLERSIRVTPARAGVELMAMPVTLGLVAPFAGRLADRIGARPLTVGGAVLTAVGLVVMGTATGSTAALVLCLIVVGAGLGAFTPANNAAIMGSAPPRQSGMASGVLNMTRGLGTSLGLACAGVVLGLAGGESPHAPPSSVRHAFTVVTWFLAAVALAAALVAGTRSSGRMESDPTLTAE